MSQLLSNKDLRTGVMVGSTTWEKKSQRLLNNQCNYWTFQIGKKMNGTDRKILTN